MKAQFTKQQIKETMNAFSEKKIEEIIATFDDLGYEYVNRCKLGGSYTDRTGNLRASLHYVVVVNGVIVRRGRESGSEKGIKAAQTLAEELAAKYSKGIYLIIMAGMHYAIYVEAKKYSVLSSFMPGQEEFIQSLKELVPNV